MTTIVTLNDLPTLEGKQLGPTDSWRSTSSGSTPSPTRPRTTSGSTSTRSGPPPVRSVGPSHTATSPSLVTPLFASLLEVEDVCSKLNYGLDKVRFPAPFRSTHRSGWSRRSARSSGSVSVPSRSPSTPSSRSRGVQAGVCGSAGVRLLPLRLPRRGVRAVSQMSPKSQTGVTPVSGLASWPVRLLGRYKRFARFGIDRRLPR
jgi:hypothetical protein